MDNGFSNSLSSIRVILRIFILGLIILLISRFLFLFVYGDLNNLNGCLKDILNAFIMGFRFDAKVLTFGLFPVALMSIGQLFNWRKLDNNSIYYKVLLIYGMILLILFSLISMIDFNFFKFFNTRISVLFFGIVEDDTKTVLKAIWTDYPVVLYTFILIVFSIFLYFLLKRLIKTAVKRDYFKSTWLKAVFIIFFFGLYFLGLRGSVGTFPLDERYSTISGNSFINTLTMNGVFALKTAWVDKKHSKINTNIPGMLNRYDFDTEREAIINYLGTNVIDSNKFSNNLLSSTPSDSFLISNPPNVVFVMMESMNGYYFDLHSPETNVLGKLEEQLSDCYVFRNFLSAGNLTIFSLEGILTGTPIAPLSQSVYQDRSLSTSVAKPFKDKGYATSFITGGEMGWRSLDKYINHQYFDIIEGKSTLKKLYPDAYTSEWGIHDEYLFDRVLQILKNSDGSPQFVFAFTISNHTPYETPESYIHYPLKINDELKSQLKATPEIAYKNLLAYQYANNCLGQFIENVRKSPLGRNTIIVATGDHTNQSLFNFTDKDLLKKYSIPLILYVPQKYQPKHKVSTMKFGSHKDIFPTIFNLALSNTTYLNTGYNLLSAKNNGYFGVYNFSLAMDAYGCVDFQNTPLFYKWERDSFNSLSLVSVAQDSHLDSLYLKARAYIASMNYYIMSELKSKKVGE